MPLQKRWRSLDRKLLGSVPDRYGMYELADEDGTILTIDHGPLRDDLKDAIAYDEAASKVRYECTHTREEAIEKVAEHRRRYSS